MAEYKEKIMSNNFHERRKYTRIDAPRLTGTFVCIDEKNKILKQGTCTTLDISETGILLEADISVDTHHILLITIPVEDDIVDIKGKVAHCTPNNEKYEIGVQFVDINWLYSF